MPRQMSLFRFTDDDNKLIWFIGLVPLDQKDNVLSWTDDQPLLEICNSDMNRTKFDDYTPVYNIVVSPRDEKRARILIEKFEESDDVTFESTARWLIVISRPYLKKWGFTMDDWYCDPDDL
jgi:hypothetical protein